MSSSFISSSNLTTSNREQPPSRSPVTPKWPSSCAPSPAFPVDDPVDVSSQRSTCRHSILHQEAKLASLDNVLLQGPRSDSLSSASTPLSTRSFPYSSSSGSMSSITIVTAAPSSSPSKRGPSYDMTRDAAPESHARRDLDPPSTSSTKVGLPTVTPPTPTNLVQRDSEPSFPAAGPQLRRARSQTHSDGRNWSRPSSDVFGPSVNALECGDSDNAMQAHTVTLNPNGTLNSSSTTTLSTLSSTTSYATARNDLSPSPSLNSLPMGLSGMPVLSRNPADRTPRAHVSGLPYVSDADFVPHGAPGYLGGDDGFPYPASQSETSVHVRGTVPDLPPGAAKARNPHTYSPGSKITAATSPPPQDSRRASVASFASGTSVDSFATALSGASDAGNGSDEDGDETVLIAPTAGLGATSNSARDLIPTTTPMTPPSAERQIITPKPSMIGSSANIPVATANLPAPVSPSRAAPLPPLTTIPLVIPVGQPVSQPASSSSPPTSTSPTSTNPPWGPNGFASFPRNRTASSGYSYTPSSPASSLRGTLPSRRPPSIPMTMNRFSMTFNASGSGPLSPGSEIGRLSPSIIVRQPPLAIPVIKLPSVLNGSATGTDDNLASGGVGRRSSVIFGSSHDRQSSRAAVKAMPALAMEGGSDDDGLAAGESDSENEDGDEDEDEDEDDGVSHGPSMDESRESGAAESPFVPLERIPLSLDLAGLGLKGKGKERESGTVAQQPGFPAQVFGTKTPVPQHVLHSDYFAMRTPTSEARTPLGMPSTPGVSSPIARTMPMPPMPGAPDRPGIYKHASRSMVHLLGSTISGDPPLEESLGDAPAYDSQSMATRRLSTMKRRRSMPEIMAVPPPYTLPLLPLAGVTGPHPLAQARVVPRDDEGRETLPAYSNSILVRAIMPRKMEFSAPGQQARDRKWRRVLCELEGTAFRMYKCHDEGWWERQVGVGDVASTAVGPAAAYASAAVKARAAAAQSAVAVKIASEEASMPDAAPETTEVVIPHRTSISSSRSRTSSSATTGSQTNADPPAASRSRLNLGSLLKPRSHGRSKSDVQPTSPPPRASLSVPRPSLSGLISSSTTVASLSTNTTPSPSKASPTKKKSPTEGSLPEPNRADLIRAYTLQNAESGLANDYLKRKHVIRVRMEGEQFLLQARDVADVVDWIEAFHSASNIALDLDERVMPKGPMFPRRRRRRQNGQRAAANALPVELHASAPAGP
ncbi:unnamed protein product [Mycena citricolor]|uniref:PH domain-containing protein n=1 Tax=Mycena citricolor TaxID=2018698 RepID=A0AAD2HIX7_9AGAR|nr:unnamed protein product [Mycena citricolor]